MTRYFKGVVAWLSQGINCILLGGHHDMTVSARCYVEYQLNKNGRWVDPYKAINTVFFWQDDHCFESFLEDVGFAEEVLKLRGRKA